jgi:hypothetical protein
MRYSILALIAMAAGCDVGLIGPDCSKSDYTTSWNICVYKASDGRFDRAEVDTTLDLFFEGFTYFTGSSLSTSSLKDFYHDGETSMTLYTDFEGASGHSAWEEGGDVDYSYNLFHPRYAMHLYLGDISVLRGAAIAHEMLHTMQFYTNQYDPKNMHGHPVDWFVDYDLTTGKYYPGQIWEDKLEIKVSEYIDCSMDPTVTPFCAALFGDCSNCTHLHE